MAAAIGVGGNGGVSVVLRERAEKGGGEEYRGSEKGQGLRGVADGVQGDEGKAASRRWPGHRQRSPPSCFGARGGRRQEKGGLGRAGGAGPGKWAEVSAR